MGWYDLQKASINPLDYSASNPQTYVLNGVNDYKRDGSSNGELIVVRLVNPLRTDFYVGYNQAIGANQETQGAIDAVVVYEKEGAQYEFGRNCLKIAELLVGDDNYKSYYRFSNNGNTEYNV